jgi:cell division protein FtsL
VTARKTGRGNARGSGARAGSGREATRRGPRGRLIVAVVLVAFVLVGAAVIWRRGVGIANARELKALDGERAQLVAERAALESAVRQAAGRSRIGGVAEQRLGMRVPADTQVVILTRAQPPDGGRVRAAATP